MSLDCHIISQKHCTAQSTSNDTKISAVGKMLIYHKNTGRVRSRKAERRSECKQEKMEENLYFYIEKTKRVFEGFCTCHIQETQNLFLTADIVKILSRNVSPKGAESVNSDLCPKTIRSRVSKKLFCERAKPGKILVNFLVF